MGMVASLMTAPKVRYRRSRDVERPYADTFSLAVKVAEAFAEQAESPFSR
jgi:hypothetical protein